MFSGRDMRNARIESASRCIQCAADVEQELQA
jgi:hypothetical protein